MTNAAQKTPISLLQELCATHSMNPDYQLMSVEGAVHAPTFMYRVQVNEIVATATGQSKKKAKHAAAKAVLEQLLSEEGGYKEGFVSDGVTVNAETLNDVISDAVETPTVDENCSKNPVGQLQELCMKRRWQPPYYETEKATGLPHEKVFSIMCMVDNFTTSGEGKSKRLAKRQAAENMLNRLKVLKIISEDEEEAVKGSKEEEDVSNSPSPLPDKDSGDYFYSHQEPPAAPKDHSVSDGSSEKEPPDGFDDAVKCTEDDSSAFCDDNLEDSLDELVIDPVSSHSRSDICSAKEAPVNAESTQDVKNAPDIISTEL